MSVSFVFFPTFLCVSNAARRSSRTLHSAPRRAYPVNLEAVVDTGHHCPIAAAGSCAGVDVVEVPFSPPPLLYSLHLRRPAVWREGKHKYNSTISRGTMLPSQLQQHSSNRMPHLHAIGRQGMVSSHPGG